MNGLFENKYYNTYYYTNIVNNILSGDVELIGFISNFFVDEDAILYLAKPFPKYSAFHSFIHNIIADFFENDMNEYDQKLYDFHIRNNYPLGSLYVEFALSEYGFDYPFKKFLGIKKDIEYSDIEAYHEELLLTGSLEELYEKISTEIFYIMFNNREALLRFNYIVAEHMDIDITEIDKDDIRKLFTKKGKLKRVRIPEWCKKAVFFRDRGRCCLCGKDLSGILSIASKKHFDHIIPLFHGGLNDISNIQLLCSECNSKKHKGKIVTSNYYEAWY